jgi:hypothetical protein
MTINTAAKLERLHPPLARDAMGNLLAIPDATAAWRICRETTGRPGEIKGPDKQPIRFPLDTTSDELAELCGPGVYRVYALDELGKQLAHVSTWDLTPTAREQRNGAGESSLLAAVRPSTAPGPVTDLRFALEAMTQMMRTHSDALRIVAESQVDLAKAIATVKGLPRNAALVPVPPPPTNEDPEEGLDDDDVEEEQPRHWVELLIPFAQKAAEIVPAFVMGKAAQKGTAVKSNVTKNDDADLASRPNWELRDLVDLQYASQKAQAKRAAREQQTDPGAAMTALQARIMSDPTLMQHLLAIKAQLAADDVQVLMAAIAGTCDEERTKVIEDLKSLPVEGAVAYCRELVKAIRAAASDTTPPTT